MLRNKFELLHEEGFDADVNPSDEARRVGAIAVGALARRSDVTFWLRPARGLDYDLCVPKQDERVQFAVRLPASLLKRVRDYCMERFVEDALREKLRGVRDSDGEDD